MTSLVPLIHLIPTRLGPLHVRDSDSDGDGPALLLWHSLFVDGRSFDALLPLLPKGYRLLCVDGPCHGRSPGPQHRFDLDDCADAAVQLLDALAIDRVHWIGNAWGGHVGAVLASRPDSPVASLVAMCSPMQALTGRLKYVTLVLLYALIGVRGPVLRGLLDALLHPDRRADDPALERYVVDVVSSDDRRPMLRAMRSVMLGRKSLIDRLPDVRCPTLFVTAEDPMWTPHVVRAQAEKLPNGHMRVMTGVRHLPPLEDPTATAEILAEWLADLSLRGVGERPVGLAAPELVEGR